MFTKQIKHFYKIRQNNHFYYAIINIKGSDSMNIYKKSINYLKKQNKYFTKTEWNKIANENNLLSARTIEYFSGKSLKKLINENA